MYLSITIQYSTYIFYYIFLVYELYKLLYYNMYTKKFSIMWVHFYDSSIFKYFKLSTMFKKTSDTSTCCIGTYSLSNLFRHGLNNCMLWQLFGSYLQFDLLHLTWKNIY